MAMKPKEVLVIIEPKDIYVGKDTAPVTLMMFGDYESDACAAANEVVKQVLEKYPDDVKLNFRHFPLTNIHQRALKAGEAAIAAGQEGKFWPMHNLLFQNRHNLGTITLKSYAREAGVTSKVFLDDLMNSTFGWQVRGDISFGQQKGVKEVPTFFLNDERYTDAISLSAFSKAIDAILASNGTKAKKVAKKRA
ncbi:MAG: thioredoxin domain-containing protein [Bacteroidota bacterium]|jgi:protein-disulfide isomerase|nr:thioredoxin domain-containing protein [Bacteroidota bacterium]